MSEAKPKVSPLEAKHSSSSQGVKSSNGSHPKQEVSLSFYPGNVSQEANLMTDPIKKNLLQARAFTPSAHQLAEKANPEFKLSSNPVINNDPFQFDMRGQSRSMKTETLGSQFIPTLPPAQKFALYQPPAPENKMQEEDGDSRLMKRM